ncbi:hypothetical protein PIB30_010569 [Stylosanthes scabra]|uniref:Uncharacterized protein n=1 Tax=Stylosanthes scabra TaxID=79078 RepID=A0ABU6S519_9FABA|nr:hypothetical protein [Stylosanthes scabra]
MVRERWKKCRRSQAKHTRNQLILIQLGSWRFLVPALGLFFIAAAMYLASKNKGQHKQQEQEETHMAKH